MPPKKYDFGGWATKNNLKCNDGRVIRNNAFKINDGKRVPLVWNHQHNDVSDVLGHAVLENRDEGVYAYCTFNNTEKAKHAKEVVVHGDVTSLSIWANNLQQIGQDVVHGIIREVSLVLAGANPGAFVESVLSHGEPMSYDDDEGIFYTGENIFLCHSETEETEETEETVQDVFNTLTDKQKKAVAIIVGQAISDSKDESDNDENEKEGNEMKHNIFDTGYEDNRKHLGESDYAQIFEDGRRLGSLKLAVKEHLEPGGILEHAALDTDGMIVATGKQNYGFNDPEMLFPEYKTLSNTPEWISREMSWVEEVMSQVHHMPFSRIKSVFANITEDEARAKGYIKGKIKKDEVFSLLKRTTSPQTVYKRQRIDRDDVIDIVDLDVVAWIKAEMRMMLNEELARAFLIGDGRLGSDDDKISEDHIRPVISDKPLFNTIIVVEVAANATKHEIADAIIDAIIEARAEYKGTGNPTLWTTQKYITGMRTLKDKNGRRIYSSMDELATTLEVTKIMPVEPMENQKISVGNDTELELIGTMVNLRDYGVGADKGGSVNLFDDFDINYNQQIYLIETRCSGALTKPFSAVTFALKRGKSSSSSETL